MACLQNDSPIVRLDGRELPVRVRRHPRARRMTLRVAPRGEALSLVLPKGVRLREGLNFLRGQEAWIKAQLDAMPRPVPFADGACLPILGTTVVILHCPQAARGVWREEDRICVSGRAEHLPRRTREFLVHLASEEISSQHAFVLHQHQRSRCQSPNHVSLRIVLFGQQLVGYDADKVIFPIRFENQDLSVFVDRARHAIAIDDERHSFHPTLWSEEILDTKDKDDDAYQEARDRSEATKDDRSLGSQERWVMAPSSLSRARTSPVARKMPQAIHTRRG